MTWFHTWKARYGAHEQPSAQAAPPPPLRAASAATPPPTPAVDAAADQASPLPPGVSRQRRATLAAAFVDSMCDRWFGNHRTAPLPVLPMDSWPLAYIAPNEHHPARMLPLTCAAMRGVYVGVGTERCWMAAAMHPQLHRLYLVDRDPRVVYYNRINVALLNAAAGARARYVSLRLVATQPEWAAAGEDLPEARRGLLRCPEAHAWWEENVRHSWSPDLRKFQMPRRGRAFAGANYLWNDQLFANVSRLATSETGVDIRRVELSCSAHLSNLRRVLAWRGESISILDISNAWWPAYLPQPALRRVLEQLSPVLTPESLLLGTSKHLGPKDDWRKEFHYFTAHPLAVLQEWPAFYRYLQELRDNSHLPGHVGRLYTTAAERRAASAARAAA